MSDTPQLARAKVFISHTHADKPLAREISVKLIGAGHEVWLDQWEMVPGDSLIEKISEGIVESSYLLVMLSKKSVEAPWVKKELETALTRQIKEKGITVIPCLIEDCEIPVFLEPIVYADFRQSLEEGIEQLLPAIKMIDLRSTGRLKDDEDLSIHDHALDWGIAGNQEGRTFFKSTFISTYATEKFSTLFTFEAEASEFLKNRFIKMPEEFLPIKLITFMTLIADQIKRSQDETEREDIGIIIEHANAFENTINMIDKTGEDLGVITIYGRRIGDVRDNNFVYYFGELVIRAIDEFVENLRPQISPPLVEAYSQWVVENPFTISADKG